MSRRRRNKKKDKIKIRYPSASPSLRKDAYFPFTDIPRPIFRDTRLYPRFFNIKKKKTWLEKKQRR